MNNNRESHNGIIKQLLRETLIMLCKNTLGYQSELSIEGLLGLTLDQNEVILVSISETISKESSELNGRAGNSDELQSELSANLVEQTASVQPDLKTRKKSTKKTRELKLSTANSCTTNRESYDADVMLPVDGKNSGDSVRIQVDFDFEKIEVKGEGDMADNQYRGSSYDKNLESEEHETEQLSSNVNPEYEDDCYIESADVQCNGYAQNNFQNIQSENSVLDHSVDSFMSLDQNIFQEVLQTDFSSSSLTYNIEGLSRSGGFEVPARPKVDRQVCRRRRQRAAFGKADDRLVTGMRRRGYTFHCRYGYTRVLHQCSQCGATFTMSSNLGRHMTTMHNMSGCDQSVLCPMCQKRFSRSDNLARHMKKVHKCASPQLTLMSSENLTTD